MRCSSGLWWWRWTEVGEFGRVFGFCWEFARGGEEGGEGIVAFDGEVGNVARWGEEVERWGAVVEL